jgi:quinolinate synthase
MVTAKFLYEKLKNVRVVNPICEFTEERCESLIPTIERIEELKKERNAIILAHNYVAPEILYGVADYTGDSYGLAKAALKSDAKTIVFAAVDFMAQTAKILNPGKTVLNPNTNGGCSLAESIEAGDVVRLREKFPEFTFICYINTTAEVKAECDVCVTSSNVYKIIENIENQNIYFLPDRLMGENVKKYLDEKGVQKNLQIYNGVCYVHEEYQPESIELIRASHPGTEVLVHPECKPEVVQKADFVGSTTMMLNRVAESSAEKFFLLTECGLTDVLRAEHPEKNFVGSCVLCRYMKSNSLSDVLRVLETPLPQDTVEISPNVIERAKLCIDQMFYYAEK